MTLAIAITKVRLATFLHSWFWTLLQLMTQNTSCSVHSPIHTEILNFLINQILDGILHSDWYALHGSGWQTLLWPCPNLFPSVWNGVWPCNVRQVQQQHKGIGTGRIPWCLIITMSLTESHVSMRVNGAIWLCSQVVCDTMNMQHYP